MITTAWNNGKHQIITCRELINKKIGIWLIKNAKAPWVNGKPPKLILEHIEEPVSSELLLQLGLHVGVRVI